jgi:acetyl esterase/lipase
MYRLLSLPFLERGFRSAILGYRTYPSATIEGQVDDLVKALELLLGRHCGVGSDRGPVVLVGHSSGAHVCLLAALTGRLPSSVDALVGASGVYDLNAQLDAEVATGVNEISPLSPCNGFARANLDAVSPVKLLLPEHLPKSFPEVLLVHGDADTVVSPQSSRDFATALGEDRCKLAILKGVGHQEVVLDTCLGGTSRTVIFDWIESTVGVGS